MRIHTARDAADLFVPLFDACESEKIVSAHLDEGRRILSMIESVGHRDQVWLPIRAIIDDALRLGTAGLIIAHNHPSGDPRPSAADLAATRALAETAASLGIHVHDHLVVGGGDCRSMRALGLI